MTLDFEAARRAGDGLVRRTPLLPAWALGERTGLRLYVKAESLQETGSFKVRGAASRLAAMSSAERRAGVVACSSGNHGMAVAFVAGRLGVRATIYVPEWVDPTKVEGIRAAGAEVVLAGATFDEAEARAVAFSAASGRVYVSAYDDPWVIAGQGTIADEIVDGLGEPPAAVLAPLSGGGLLGGMAARFDELAGRGTVRVVGVSAKRAAVMLRSLDAGRPLELPEEETLASALSGGIGLHNRHSFPLVRDRIAEHVSVEEEEIAAAMRYCVQALRLVVEGGGATALAAVLGGAWRGPVDGAVVVVLSGGNVALDTLAGVLRAARD